ncbi:MAG: hypothetical protein ACRCWF_17700 [Beijerinckiaceae bacterium]
MATYRGSNSTIEIGSTADPTTAIWTVIQQVTEFTIESTVDQLDASTLASTQMEYIPALRDSAEISLTMNYDPSLATQNEVAGLEALFNAGTQRAIRITKNGTAVKERYPSCFVTNSSRNFQPNEIQRLEITLKSGGAVSYL